MILANIGVYSVIIFMVILAVLTVLRVAITRQVWRGREVDEDGVYEFRGGMSISRPFHWAKRLNASGGLALLRISDRGFWLGTTTRAIPADLCSVEYLRPEVREVFPAWGLLTRAIGIATTDGRTHYFWTSKSKKRAVLAAFTTCDYVIGARRRARSMIVEQLPLWPKRRSSRC